MSVIVKGLSKLGNINNPLVRDFTTSAEKRLKQIANDVDDSDDWFDTNITDRFGRWLNKKGYLYLLKNTIDYQRAIIDCYNYNFSVIERIFEAARSLDGTSGSKIANYNGQAETGVMLVKALAECLDVSKVTERGSVSEQLFWFDTSWTTNADGELVKISELETDLNNYFRQHKKYEYSENDIVDFCNQVDSVDAFSDYYNYIYIDELDYGTLEATGMIVFLGAEITKDEIISIISSEGYNEKAARENLSALIESVISADNNCESFIKDHELAKDTVLDFIKKYEKYEKEAFEKEHPGYKYSDWEKFIQFAGGIDVVKEMAEKYPELLDYLFTDYSKGSEILASFENLGGNNLSAEMQSAINKLRTEYDNKWKGMTNKLWNEGFQFAADQGADKLKKWVKDNVPEYSILTSLLEISGGEEKAKAYSKLLSIQNIASDTKTAFKAAVEKVQSGSYTKQDLKNVENLFNLLKETHVTMYKSFRDMCVDEPLKQVYANEQIEKLNRMTMNNYQSYGF